ncbi:MAG: AAA domain-containing protein [Bradyrhizobium sp.]
MGRAKRLGATVDEFQGSEADIVVASLVRNNDEKIGKGLGFLADDRRVNVLLSRARHKLVLVGSWSFLARLTGSFFEPPALTLVHRDSIAPDAITLSPRISKLVASPEGAIDRLYMKEDEAFEEWVDCRVTSMKYFAAVVVNGHALEGLPAYTAPALRYAIQNEMEADGSGQRTSTGIVEGGVERRLETADGYCSACVSPDDFVIGGPAHFELLKNVFAKAKKFVLIHTCFVSSAGVSRLLPFMEEAAAKGIYIDLLWGQRTEKLNESSRKDFLITKSIFDKLSADLKARIRFSERETGSHAKVVLSDSGPENSYEAYVGSCNWLSSLFKSTEVSIRIREPRVIATLAGALATLRIHPSARWDADVYRLSELRDTCRKAPECLDGTHSIAVVRARRTGARSTLCP